MWVSKHERPEPETRIIKDNDYICQVVSKHLSVSIEDMKSKSRKREYVTARQFSISFMRKQGQTLTSIGNYFNMDHSSVMHNLRALQDLIDTDKIFNGLFEKVKTELL